MASVTYEEAVAELAEVRAAIKRIQGTVTSGGAQEISTGSSRIVRAPLETLYKRESYLNAIIKRLDPSDGGGAVRQPLFPTRS